MRRPQMEQAGKKRWMRGVLALLVSSLAGGSAAALTLPVEHQGGLRAAASFVEDHGGWHSGIDLPASDGAGRCARPG
ncbi:MAG: hypothetical protein IPK72_21975 [Candidatus Eisenbacteria bacterium]|nr:hypothetical protein [Candidatus Eisenbacteria bacterium]